MNTNQKKFTAFMESVCTKFSRADMLPTLEAGFKAFCESIEVTKIIPEDVINSVQALASRHSELEKINDTNYRICWNGGLPIETYLISKMASLGFEAVVDKNPNGEVCVNLSYTGNVPENPTRYATTIRAKITSDIVNGTPSSFKEICANDEKLNAINAKKRANEAQYDELDVASSELNQKFIDARSVAGQLHIKQKINEMVTTMGTLLKENRALTDEYNKRLVELRSEYDAAKGQMA